MIEVYLKDTKLEILNTADLPSGKKFKSRFIQPGLAGYPQQYGNVLITKESLDKFVNTLEGKPVIINHQEVTTKNIADIEVGRVHNVWFNDEDGWYWCDGILTSQNAIDLINDGYSVSCSYNVSDYIDKGGTVNNIKYDMEFLNGVFTHLAIVNNPRYEDAEITVINNKGDDMAENVYNADDKGRWITIKGNHIFIPDGKSVDEVVKERFDTKEEMKKEDKVSEEKNGFKKDKDSGLYMKDLSDGSSVYVEKKKGEEGESEAFYMVATHYDKDGKILDKKEYHYDNMDGMFNKINRDFKPFEDKKSDTTEGGEDKTRAQKVLESDEDSLYKVLYHSMTGNKSAEDLMDKIEEELREDKSEESEKARERLYKIATMVQIDLQGRKNPRSNNSLTNTIVSALAEVIAENCIKKKE